MKLKDIRNKEPDNGLFNKSVKEFRLIKLPNLTWVCTTDTECIYINEKWESFVRWPDIQTIFKYITFPYSALEVQSSVVKDPPWTTRRNLSLSSPAFYSSKNLVGPCIWGSGSSPNTDFTQSPCTVRFCLKQFFFGPVMC